MEKTITSLLELYDGKDLNITLDIVDAYLYGIYGAQVDYKAAKKYLDEAGALKDTIEFLNVEARYYEALGTMYHHGYGVDKDYKKAMEFYNLAADGGHSGLTYMCGLASLFGVEVKQDDARAFELFTKLYECYMDCGLGTPIALPLAECYYYGIGTNKDSIRACKLYVEVFEQYLKEIKIYLLKDSSKDEETTNQVFKLIKDKLNPIKDYLNKDLKDKASHNQDVSFKDPVFNMDFAETSKLAEEGNIKAELKYAYYLERNFYLEGEQYDVYNYLCGLMNYKYDLLYPVATCISISKIPGYEDDIIKQYEKQYLYQQALLVLVNRINSIVSYNLKEENLVDDEQHLKETLETFKSTLLLLNYYIVDDISDDDLEYFSSYHEGTAEALDQEFSDDDYETCECCGDDCCCCEDELEED